MRFKRYRYVNPAALPADWDAGLDPDQDWDEVVKAAGFNPTDEEVGVGRLTEAWHGHPVGVLVVSGLTVQDYPFAVEV